LTEIGVDHLERLTEKYKKAGRSRKKWSSGMRLGVKFEHWFPPKLIHKHFSISLRSYSMRQ
jgi:hypothetical protein